MLTTRRVSPHTGGAATYFFAIGLALLAPSWAGAQRVDTSLYAGMRWRLIGPYRSGKVAAVTGIPGDLTTYYAGMPEGGVWKTTDAGTVWTPIFDDQHVPSIGAVAVAPSNHNIVYVGTGDPSGWSFTPGHGVYKSTDAGKTWQRIGLEQTRYITSMMVDPHDANIVAVAALGASDFGGGANPARGVYRTADGGQTWRRVLYKDAYTGPSALTFDNADPKIMYVALERNTLGLTKAQRDSLAPIESSGGIYKSADEGLTWTPVGGRGLPEANFFSIAMASGTQGRRLYAEPQWSAVKGLWRSDDGGATWVLGTRAIASAEGPIYVDPGNPDRVYLMGTSMYGSVDGGHHFVALKGSPGGDDPRELWIDPSNPRHMFLGVDQGPTITVDGGETWTPWYNLPNGQFYRVLTDTHYPYRVCSAQQDAGTACVLSRSDFGEIRDNDWSPVGGYEAGMITTDPLNDRWIYTQGMYHVLRRYDRETGQVVVLYTPTPEDRFGVIPPLVFSPQDPHLLYLAAQYVLASTDGARDWRRVSPDLTVRPGGTTPSWIQALAPSPVTAGVIWAGTYNGLIHLTRDGGQTWTNVTPPGLPAQANVNIMDASHHATGTAYAAVDYADDHRPHIYRTTDFGQRWQDVVTGITDNALVRTVREDPVDPNVVYAGTELGVWVSFDRGDHWQTLQLNLPNTVVSDIAVHGSDLAISTYGRSLWILDDVIPLRQVAAAQAAQAYLYRPETAYRTRGDNIQDTPLPPEVPAGQNPPEGAIIDYYLKGAASGPVTLSVYDMQDRLVREYSSVAPPSDTSMPNVPTYWFEPPTVLPTTAGMHRIAWDLRYASPPALPYGYSSLLTYGSYTSPWHAVKGHMPRELPVGPMVVPGTYRVRLSVGGQTYTQDLTIDMDPRVSITPDGLTAQLQSELRMASGITATHNEFHRILKWREILAADEAAAKGKPQEAQILAAAQAVDSQAAALAGVLRRSAQGHTEPRAALRADADADVDAPHAMSAAVDAETLGLANRNLVRHLEDSEVGDLEPTASDLAAVELDCRSIDAALTRLRQLQASAVPSLNALLAGAQLTPLPTVAVPPGPACRADGGRATQGR